MKKLIFPAIFLVAMVTFACQPQMQSAQNWVNKPSTTQPGAPTNGQVIQAVSDTAAPFLPAPWGYVISGVITGGLLLLKHVSDTKQTSSVQGSLKTVAQSLTDVASTIDTVHNIITTPPPPPSTSNVTINPPAVTK